MNNHNMPWPGVQASNFFTSSQKRTFALLCEKMEVKGMLNESVLSKIRDGLDKMRQDGHGDIDELTIDKLQDVMMSASKFAAYLDQHFNKVYDKVLAYYKTGLEPAKTALIRKIRAGQFAYPSDNIDKEIDDLKKLSIFWLKDFKGTLSTQNIDKFSKCLIAESMNRTADIITLLGQFNPGKLNEGKDPWGFLDLAKQVVSNTEPFKTINGIADLRQNVGNTSLNKFAQLSNQIGGPECCKLTGLGAIAGKLAELRETTVTSEGIMKKDPILRFMPTGKALIESFEMIAFMVTVLELMSELKNQK